MSWAGNYRWLDAFWREVIAGRGRRWVLAGLLDRDLFVRDALAHAVLRERLAHEGRDVRCQFVHPFEQNPDVDPPGPKEDMLVVGRPKGYGRSILKPLVEPLEPPGRFIDPDEKEFGGAVVYDGQRFRRHDLDVPELYTRCDVDYGLLCCRRVRTRDGEHLVIALAGLSTLGTLGLALILTDDERRELLARQVRELLPWRAGLRPDLGIEICVRISVAGEQQLVRLANRLEFFFRADAVVVASRLPGRPVVQRIRTEAEPEIVLIPEKNGGFVRLPGAGQVKLPRTRFALLRLLVERPAEATRGMLRVHFADGGKKRRLAPGGRLAKLVHDLNASLRTLPGLEATRPVRFKRKDARYALVGVRGSLLGARSRRSSRPRRRPRTRAPRRRDDR